MCGSSSTDVEEWKKRSRALGLEPVESSTNDTTLGVCPNHTPKLLMPGESEEIRGVMQTYVVRHSDGRILWFRGHEIVRVRSQDLTKDDDSDSGEYTLLKSAGGKWHAGPYILAYVPYPDADYDVFGAWVDHSLDALVEKAAKEQRGLSRSVEARVLGKELVDKANDRYPLLHRMKMAGILLWYSHDVPIGFYDGQTGNMLSTEWTMAIQDQMREMRCEGVVYEMENETFQRNLGSIFGSLRGRQERDVSIESTLGVRGVEGVESLGTSEEFESMKDVPWLEESRSRMLKSFELETETTLKYPSLGFEGVTALVSR